MNKMKESEIISHLVAADSFSLSAKMWNDLKLPDFTVMGYKDGEHKIWTVSELLVETARLIKDKVKDNDSRND